MLTKSGIHVRMSVSLCTWGSLCNSATVVKVNLTLKSQESVCLRASDWSVSMCVLCLCVCICMSMCECLCLCVSVSVSV